MLQNNIDKLILETQDNQSLSKDKKEKTLGLLNYIKGGYKAIEKYKKTMVPVYKEYKGTENV